MAESWDSGTKEAVKQIPLLTSIAGPRDKQEWQEKRLKQELQSLIKYIQLNKQTDSDWFTITSNKDGTHWSGKCWGGKICLTVHFKPLWAKNSPHFGIAHALCLGLAPWLAAEIPYMIGEGAIKVKS
ncbi:hypothetical protein WJX74_004167 [Apatococcus lobatus]|uniref:Ubiquitin-fold modifier-conjugating enzyme 1 n=1 Tax=Apatococcus lobatus TaxID=904363 RepID=A0AAW1RZS3_9CHLO